jgi:hypothetical protein
MPKFLKKSVETEEKVLMHASNPKRTPEKQLCKYCNRFGYQKSENAIISQTKPFERRA